MHTFDTPGPISVAIELYSGDVRIVAGDRPHTVVDVVATNQSRGPDVAARTQVEFANGRLHIKNQPRGLRGHVGWRKGDAVSISIELPAGSHVRGEALSAQFRGQGALGDCQFQIMSGDVSLEQTGALRFSTTSGDLTVGRACGPVEVSSMSSRVRIDRLEGTAVIQNAAGDMSLGDTLGAVRMASAKGRMSVGRVEADLTATTGAGDVRIGEVVRGVIEVSTGGGEVEVGVREGTAAWVDASSRTGTVRNSLDAQDGPEHFQDVARLRIRGNRDVVIKRASSPHRDLTPAAQGATRP